MSDRKVLKIAYVIPKFHPFKGGAELNILAMASRMAYKGYDVTVLTSDAKFRDTKPPKFEEYRGIKIKRHKAFINRPSYLNFMPGLLRSLLREDYDVIHVSGFGFMWFEFCFIIKKLLSRNTKFINTPHGPFMANSDEKGVRLFAKNFYTGILRMFLPKLYSKVIAVVPVQRTWITKDYGFKESQIEVIPNGIEITYIEEKVHEFDKSEKVVITYLNRMEWYKGVQNVIEAINLLLSKNKNLPRFEFRVMGRPGGYTNTLKALVTRYDLSEIVKFIYSPSDVERDKIFYEESQINILPSKWEGTGIALIEAMAKGNVIITTLQNQAHDILIKEGVSGFSYDFYDVKKLASILESLLTDFELRQSIRRHNIEFAKEFTWEAVFPKYEEMINSISKVNN